MKPNGTISTYILLTALTPISHHDPATQDGSNVLTFNRQRQVIDRKILGKPVDQTTIDDFCAAHPVPLSVHDALSGMMFSEFVATALIKIMIQMYNSQDGTGLFSGMERYALLESRTHAAAVRSSTLQALWSTICRDMQFPIHGGIKDFELLCFFALPLSIQEAAIGSLVKNYRTVLISARVWAQQEKLGNEQYANALGLDLTTDQLQVLRFNANDIRENFERMVIEVPAVSANSLRHQMIREPGWLHLFDALDLSGETLPVEAEAIFYNGGNIKSGAKQPSNAYALARTVRQTYPLLNLLGGVCDSFDLGESLLSVSAWLVCSENASALGDIDSPMKSISAFEMLDNITHTRQATGQGVGQMIYNFEVLVPGTQFLVRLALKSYADRLAIGALSTALKTYLNDSPTIAGQSSRGFGVVGADWAQRPAEMGQAEIEYATYLAENHNLLREGILNGTLGTSVRVVS